VPGYEPQAAPFDGELDPPHAADSDLQSSAADGAPRGLDPNGGVKGRRKSRKDKLREAAASSSATATPPNVPATPAALTPAGDR
jgi:hypothetical protein